MSIRVNNERDLDNRFLNFEAGKQAAERLGVEKEEHQYKAYLENVNTLNQMKKAFKTIYPTMRQKDNGRKAKKLVGIIMKYEQDIQDYVDAWTNNYDKAGRKHFRNSAKHTSGHN